jgi:WD40 repeat protein
VEVETRHDLRRWDFGTEPRAGSFNKDGHLALLGTGSNLTFFDVENNKLAGGLRCEESLVQTVALLPDGRRALTLASGKVLLYNLDTKRKIREFKDRSGFLTGVAVSADGKLALSSGGNQVLGPDGKQLWRDNEWVYKDCVVRVWDIETGREMRPFEGHAKYIHAVCFVGDGSRALSSGDDATFLWDVNTAQEIRRFNFRPQHHPAVTPDGKQALLFPTRDKLVLWDLDNDTAVRTFEDPPDRTKGVVLSPDGSLAVAFGLNGKVTVYDMVTGRPKYLLEGGTRSGVSGVMISPGGHRALVLYSDNLARSFDLTPKKAPPKQP